MRWTNSLKALLTFPILFLPLSPVLANVEKAIFLGPETVRIPSQHPTLSDLHLDALTPLSWSLRTALSSQFPDSKHPAGKATWLLLDGLDQNQRYEVRVCWAATQPTSFTLNTYSLDTVFATPSLITSLNEYSLTRQPSSSSPPLTQDRESSLLFLQILTAADYFTTNATLMNQPPPVDVDIILDPFLLNVLPRSLLPTVLYIVVVAVAGFLVSRKIVSFLETVISSPASIDSLDKKKN